MLEYEISRVGLGTTIIILSTLLHSGLPITLRAPTEYTALREIKHIFNISDKQLTIIDQEQITNDIWLKFRDYSKFFSPYFNVNNLTLFDRQYSLSTQRKPCIALATWDLSHELANNAFPYNRLYSKEFWACIFQLVLSADYDVITLNKQDISIEEKVWMLNNHCDCVISYEGGICHLAHLLKIPTIIMPWHHHEDGSQPEVDISYVPQKLHLDTKTYFVKSEQEILSWTPRDLCEVIQQLHFEKGNNVFFNNNLTINPHNFVIKTSEGLNLTPGLSTFEKDFINMYIKTIAIGGKIQ